MAAALFLVLNALPALAGQPPAPPWPRPARFVEPPPQAVEQGVARLHQACSAWLHRPAAADRDAPPSVAPERRVCAFVLDPGGQSADYMIKGGIVLAIVLIPAGLLIGAFWSALCIGARNGRSAAAWLRRRAARVLSDVA